MNANDLDTYSVQLRRIIRTAGLLMPVFAIILGLAARAEIFPSGNYVSDAVFFSAAGLFALMGLWQYFSPRTSQPMLGFILFSYHLFGSLFLLFVSGLPSPIIMCWLVLLIAADIFYGSRGLFASIAWLFATATVDYFLHPSDNTGAAIEITLSLFIILGVGWVVSRLRKLGDTQHQALGRTKREEALQRNRLMTLINGMDDAVISLDPRGHVKLCNQAAMSLLELKRSLTGKSVDEVLQLRDKNNQPVNLTATLNEPTHMIVRTDLIHKFEGGEKINLFVSVAPVWDDDDTEQRAHRGFIVVLRDITKEKSLEEERDEFIGVVSHELRTPIATTEAAISFLQYLSAHHQDDPAQLNRALESAHKQVLFLAKMINDLSTLSRAERGVADNPELIDVYSLMLQQYNKYYPETKTRKLEFKLDTDPSVGYVLASQLYLEETLQNFLTNSLKYTRQGSVTLSAHRQDDKILFSVADTGIGISKSDQKHMFEKFYRSEDYRTRESPGTGLGLYVVKKLAAKLGTRIHMDSELNKGSTFSFSLPLAAAPDIAVAQTAPSVTAAKTAASPQPAMATSASAATPTAAPSV
jgi:PAS domain S-box-containing protein